MILDYLRRVSHLRLFGSVSITRQNRDPPIEWNADYEKQWRDECTRRLTVSNDDRCDTAPTATIDISDDEEGTPTIATDLLECNGKVSSEHPCINTCIHVQPTAYQKLQCDQAVVSAESTLFNSKNRFERLLNILGHPDSEITHDNDMPDDKVQQSGKTAFLFALLSRLASLNKTFDIAIMTNDHDTESVVYQILRFHGYQCQRIPVILEDDWSSEHGVFFTTSEEASYRKWSARPSIDIILMFDIRINNNILSKVEGDKRMLWIISKDTVEDRAFSILQQESDKWQDVWRRNKALQNTITETNSWDNSLSFEESVQKSADQAFEFLFPGNNKRPRSPQADISPPPPKRRPSIIILDSSDDEQINLVPAEQLAMQPQPKPAPLDVNHFEIRTIEMIDHASQTNNTSMRQYLMPPFSISSY
ncbi:hypothetical protein BJV82DRAFT_617584 [Fennellomyces sp. T-0311]|nr:hypothetical protein BJV82DRAFT_617584 [Fennellomyces sp. T-0311]